MSRYVEDLEHVPSVGDEITLEYEGETGRKEVRGTVSRTWENEDNTTYKFRLEDSQGLVWEVGGNDHLQASMDIYVKHSDGWYRMNVVPGAIGLVELHN